jgi:type I restriction enzyme S subunit
VKGLEVSILSLKNVLEENGKARIDNAYFTKAAIEAERLVETLPNDTLGALSSVFRKGIFDIKADTYVDPGEGVPFIRITDIKTGMIQKHSTAWIDHAVHAIEAKTALQFGDLVLSKTAYPAASMVNVPECNVSQDTIAIKLTPAAKREYRPGFIAAYLNAKQGLALMARRFQGNVQQHLSLEDGKSLRVPRLTTVFQERVHNLVLAADKQQEAVTQSVLAAETKLLNALGLAEWTPPSPRHFIQSMKHLRAASRMDAEFFDPRHLYAEEVISKRPFSFLGKLSASVQSGPAWPSSSFLENSDSDGTPFVRIRNCKPGVIHTETLDRLSPDGIKKFDVPMAQNGDLVIGMDGIKWFYAGVLDGPAFINQRVAWVRLAKEGLDPHFVQLVINSPLGQAQLLRRMTIAQTVGHITLDDIRAIKIPIFDANEYEAIVNDLVSTNRASRKATLLLAAAKHAVEIAIEKNEVKATAYLDQQEGAN